MEALLAGGLVAVAPAEARPPLPENPDTTLLQNNMAERTVAEGIRSAAKARGAVASAAANATAKARSMRAAPAAVHAIANEAISAPCAED